MKNFMSNLDNSTEYENERTKRRKKLDAIVFETIKGHPGYTLKQLQQLLFESESSSDFDVSFLTNSLARLKDVGEIFSQTQDIIHGKAINAYYTFDEDDTKSSSELKLKEHDFCGWLGYSQEKIPPLIAYALDKNTIIIATESDSNKIIKTKFSGPLEIKTDSIWIELKFNQDFVDFYDLNPGKFLFKFRPYEKAKAIILTIIPNKPSKDEIISSQKKNILILEDIGEWASELAERLTQDGHNVEYTTTIDGFREKLSNPQKMYDVVSLDKKIIDENDDLDVAGKLFFEIKRRFPDAKVGLLSRKIEPSEFDYYKRLGFSFILQKYPKNRNRGGFNQVGDELVATLKVL